MNLILDPDSNKQTITETLKCMGQWEIWILTGYLVILIFAFPSLKESLYTEKFTDEMTYIEFAWK